MIGHEKIQPTPEKIFVSRGKEAEYCQAHQIELRRLANGITIVGIPREVADLARASINFAFPSGSFFDPPGKVGLHHLVEHLFLINRGLTEPASRLDVYLNALTSSQEIRMFCSGPANSRVRNYGLWPILPTTQRVLTSPLQFLKNPTRAMEKEKQVIQTEIAGNYADHRWLAQRYLNEIVFDPSNPVLIDTPGTPESLAAITIKDVIKLTEEVFIPRGLLISVFGEGKPEICRNLTDRLIALFENFPREEKVNRQIDWSLWERLNPGFKPGQRYKKDTGLKNGLITLMFVWTFQRQPFTPSDFALSRLIPVINNKLYVLSRKEGWAYSSETNSLTAGLTAGAGAVFLRLDIPKKASGEVDSFLKQSWPKMEENVLVAITPKEIATLVRTEQRRQVAVPLPTELRLQWLLLGLTRWGQMIDAEKIKDTCLQINPQHLQTWQEKLLSQPPAVVIVGDLG